MNTPAVRLALAAVATASLLLALPGRARAGVTVYNDPADFDAAATGVTSYTFSGAPAGSYTPEGTSYTSGPLTFSGPGINLFNDNSFGPGVTYVDEFNGPETITLSGATAVDFTIGTFDGAQTVAISVNGAPATSVTEAGGKPDTLFVGFTDTVPITSLTFTNTSVGGGDQEIDVIGYQTNAVPEPGTWALLAAGAGGLLLIVRRRARRTVA